MSVTLTSQDRAPVFPPKNSDAALAVRVLPLDLRSSIVIWRSLNVFLVDTFAVWRRPLFVPI
jgi:hypothetical protein